jgi:5'-nucleotidase
MEGRADLLFSGINEGSNLGWDLTYSGTVAAAIEGAILGLPSVAVSVVENGSELNFEPAARFSRTLAEAIRDNGMERWTLLNVNVPALSLERIRGVTVTHQGRRQYVDRIDRRVDPWGRAYYWLRGSLKEETPDEGSDVHAILENRISVTPIHLDMTAYSLIAPMREWNLG